MCVDLTKLTQAVKRELYQMPTKESTLGRTEEGAVHVLKVRRQLWIPSSTSRFQQP